jgi:hypothetical protein
LVAQLDHGLLAWALPELAKPTAKVINNINSNLRATNVPSLKRQGPAASACLYATNLGGRRKALPFSIALSRGFATRGHFFAEANSRFLI